MQNYTTTYSLAENPNLLFMESESEKTSSFSGVVLYVAQSTGDNIINSGDVISFESGLQLEYNLNDGVGIRSSAAVSGFISNKNGQVTVGAQVLHGEKFIDYNYTATVRIRSGEDELGFLSLSRSNSESALYGSIYNYLGSASFNIPSNSGSLYLDVNIGYWVNTGAGFFNGNYFNQTYILNP